MQSKKSQVEDWLPYLFLVIFVVIASILIFFGGNGRAIAAKEKSDEFILNMDSSQLLQNFLRTPAIENSLENAADQLNYYFLDDGQNSLNAFSAIAKPFFDKSQLESDYSSWSMTVKYPGKKDIFIESEKSRQSQIQRKEISKILVPTPIPENNMEIILFWVQTKFVAE